MVAARYTKNEEEIILETSNHDKIPQEKKEEEMKQTKEPTKGEGTTVLDLSKKSKQKKLLKMDPGQVQRIGERDYSKLT